MNKQAKDQANKVPEEDREKETAKKLLESAKNIKQGTKDLETALKGANEAFGTILSEASGEDQQAAILAFNKANKLLRELKQGGDLNTIISKIKAIK